MKRRDLLHGAALSAAWATLGTVIAQAPALRAQAGGGEAFDWGWLRSHARELAGGRYEPPVDARPPQLRALSWDEYAAIRFRPEEALWRHTELPFQIQFFHLGIFYDTPVRVYEVAGGAARPVRYDPSMFDFGPSRFEPPLPDDLGFAGLRVHAHTDFDQDVIVFQGASYFRATHWRSHYGMSARGLAVDTALGRPEEFPRFTSFWLERPSPEDATLTVYALLESESVTGAYRFLLAPGGTTVMEVAAHLFPRKPIERLGLAPLTSMYQFGENDRRVADDWRREIHDSDGLSIWTGAGEWIWRPLVNPPELRVSSFVDNEPRGFGLIQRDRDFTNYQDEGAQYERRPSCWVEPLEGWGPGRVMLVEIPTADETFDNIVAFWNPERPVEPGQELALRYRLTWGDDVPVNARLARCTATRIGKGGIIGHRHEVNLRKFVIDFAGGELPLIDRKAPVEPVISASRGRIADLTALDGSIRISPLVRPVPEIGGWRVTFDLEWEGREPIDLRLYLRLGPSTLTETWLYQWTPPHG
ncbi:glucan biosynthesis protein [Geminicoccaceae bacterium 1502E]|nr:glucan biosynthesis protein [Geminicoccaceae bacterium 1502E]